jgi:tetratricopeptide (TPR) repeat protein
MPSVIPGFEYDIFISYRQKDNKYDGWVTEFVDHLNRELEATFKEDISVYFDVNPHDGLLETHDVDASLKEKLKCLIFIPVISQTYCDPKSFAWEHEFKPFVQLASQDPFGLKVKLSNGNVASRVLPVRIHDLDADDYQLCESVMGGVLRGVDFIYKEPGVNRPLTPEDDEKKNLDKTKYRNQINKVANAVKEIILGLKHGPGLPAEENTPLKGSKTKSSKYGQRKESITAKIPGPKLKKRLLLLLAALLSVAGAYSLYRIIDNLKFNNIEKSIAVLTFDNPIHDEDTTYSSDMMTELINTDLVHIRKFTVRSNLASYKYKAEPKSYAEIGRELKANFIVKVSMQKITNPMLVVNLINTKAEKDIWGDIYDLKLYDIFSLLRDISTQIAISLKTDLSPEERNQIDNKPTRNPIAYINQIQGDINSEDAQYNFHPEDKYFKGLSTSASLRSAITSYDKAIKSDSSFAYVYARRAIIRSWAIYFGYFDKINIETNKEKCLEDIEKALEIDKDLTEAQVALGFYYYYCKEDYRKAREHFRNALIKEPHNWHYKYYMALILRRTGYWEESQKLMAEVLASNPQDALLLTNIGASYVFLHKYDTALICHDKAIEILPNWSSPYHNKMEALLLKYGNTKEARNVRDTAIMKTGNSFQETRILLDYYDGKFKEALNQVELSDPKDFINQGERYMLFARIYNCLNNAALVRKYYESALNFYTNELIDHPKSPNAFSSKGISYAGLKNRGKAIEAGEEAVKLVKDDLVERMYRKQDLALIYGMIGDYNRSSLQIEELLKYPSYISAKYLQLDPVWKPLAGRPEFQAILNRYSKN